MAVNNVGNQNTAPPKGSAQKEANKYIKEGAMSKMIQSLTQVNVSSAIKESSASRSSRAQQIKGK